MLDDTTIISASNDATIKVWAHDAYETKGPLQGTLYNGHSSGIVKLSGDDSYLVSIDSYSTKVWNRRNGTPILSIPKGGQDVNVAGKYVLVASSTVINVLDRDTGDDVRVLQGHDYQVNCIYTSSSIVVSGDSSGKVKMWDVEKGEELKTFEGQTGGINAVALDGTHVLSGGDDCTAKLWDRESGEEVLTLNHENYIYAVDMNENVILTGGYDNNVRIWERSSGTMQRILQGHASPIYALAVDTAHVVSGSSDKTVRVWDLRTGAWLRTLEGHTSDVKGLMLDDTTIISASNDASIMEWQIMRENQLRLLRRAALRCSSNFDEGSCRDLLDVLSEVVPSFADISDPFHSMPEETVLEIEAESSEIKYAITEAGTPSVNDIYIQDRELKDRVAFVTRSESFFLEFWEKGTCINAAETSYPAGWYISRWIETSKWYLSLYYNPSKNSSFVPTEGWEIYEGGGTLPLPRINRIDAGRKPVKSSAASDELALSTLQTKVAELQQQLLENESRMRAMSRRNPPPPQNLDNNMSNSSSLQKEINELHRKLSQKDSEIEQLKQAPQPQLERIITEQKETIVQSEAKINDLQKKLQDARLKGVQEAAEQNESEEKKALEASNLLLQQEITRLKERAIAESELEQENLHLKDEISTLKAKRGEQLESLSQIGPDGSIKEPAPLKFRSVSPNHIMSSSSSISPDLPTSYLNSVDSRYRVKYTNGTTKNKPGANLFQLVKYFRITDRINPGETKTQAM